MVGQLLRLMSTLSNTPRLYAEDQTSFLLPAVDGPEVITGEEERSG
jgi:hypothetical protein